MTGDCKPYRPSNSSEAVAFMNRWCARCQRDSVEEDCELPALAQVFDIGDPDYPAEWVYGNSGPVCTAFVDVDTLRSPIIPAPGQGTFFGGQS